MKKKRVETFRNIRYPVGRTIIIYIYIYRQRVQVVTLGGLAPARPIIFQYGQFTAPDGLYHENGFTPPKLSGGRALPMSSV